MNIQKLLLLLIVSGNFFFSSINAKEISEQIKANTSGEIKKLSGSTMNLDLLKSYLKQQMVEHKIPGLSMAIINDGEVAFHTTLGFADNELKRVVDKNTLFEGASTSKPLFGFIAVMLVESGILDLDVPLYRYLPYTDIAYDDRYKKITARMVLTHTTGFPNWRSSDPEGKLKLQFNPGSAFNYSGEGYQYLAKVMAHLLQTDDDGLEHYFQQKIANPLNMQHTQYIPDANTLSRKAMPYKKGQRISLGKKSNEFGAAYSIHTEALDYARWLQALMDKKILSDTAYNTFFKPQNAPIPEDDPQRNLGLIDWALGFSVYQTAHGLLYAHGGNNPGYSSLVGIQPEKKWGLVIFTNADQASDFLLPLALMLTQDIEF